MELEKLKEYIKNNEYINAQKEAHVLVEKEEWDSSLKEVIKILYQNNAKQKMIEVVIQHWDDLFDITTVVLKVVRDYLVSREMVCYLLKELDFIDDLPYLLERCFDLKRNGNYDIIARNLISYFSQKDCFGSIEEKEHVLSLGEAQFLLHNAREYQDKNRVDCKDVFRFFEYYIGSLTHADVPQWVSLLEGENLSLLKTVSPGLAHEERQVLGEKYITQAKDLFYSINQNDEIKGKKISVDMQKALESFLSVMSVQNSKVVHNPNRIFGPLNAFKDRNCVSSPGKEGPCRMLECRCRNSSGEDWYNGRCDHCSISIRDRSHALRMPTKEGGWFGCFCSFKCLEEGIPFRDEDINIKLETMKYTLIVDGIMNRAIL